MKQHLIDPKLAINAYQKIVENGERSANGHLFKGVTASSDFDGYTVFLKDSHVAMDVYYHYKYKLDYRSTDELEQFETKLKNIVNS